jgi:CRISPR/Cas system CSM-associated protein Csm3 (group 7 of RAMP superfamily)
LALFDEQLEFDSQFALDLSLRQPTDAEVGLLLLVLKGLWTGFLPVGMWRSRGYGQLKGLKAMIHYRSVEWTLTTPADFGGPISVVPSQGMAAVGLNRYVTAFKNEMEGKL